MFGGVAFLLQGRMCCGIVGSDLVVRVVEPEMGAALARRHVRPMDFTGRPMRGFVYVSPSGCRTAAALRAWIDHGLRFVTASDAPGKWRTGARVPSAARRR